MSFSKVPKDELSTMGKRGAALGKDTITKYIAAENALSSRFEVNS